MFPGTLFGMQSFLFSIRISRYVGAGKIKNDYVKVLQQLLLHHLVLRCICNFELRLAKCDVHIF